MSNKELVLNGSSLNQTQSEQGIVKDEATGRFAKGHKSPGRTKGSVNRLTALKQELANEDNSAQFLKNFEEMLFSESKRERAESVKMVVSILPRDDKLTHEIAQLIINKEVIVSKCPTCGHNSNDCKVLEVIGDTPS